MMRPITRFKPGDIQDDNSIYAGISPETGNPMYATPTDAPLRMRFNEAIDYAKKLNRDRYLGHDDWRVPTKAELNVLFNNRAAIGGFDQSGSDGAGWYASSTQYSFFKFCAWNQRFSDGDQDWSGKIVGSSLRCVR